MKISQWLWWVERIRAAVESKLRQWDQRLIRAAAASTPRVEEQK
jgi:hypothetical protein